VDLSDNSDDDLKEDEEDEIFHSVERYDILCIDLSVMSKFIFHIALVREI
jgi:hypothetical protein